MAQVTTRLNQHWTRERPGNLTMVVDDAANDSDKTLTVPTGEIWELRHVLVDLATSADVGNRQMRLILGDGVGSCAYMNALNVQAESTQEYYNFGIEYDAVTEAPAGYHFLPLPLRFAPAGFTIRAYDTAGIAAAADDMRLRALVNVYPSN